VPNYLHDSATCMTSLFSEQDVPGSASQLVVATEFKWLLIANAAGTEFAVQVRAASPPVHAARDRRQDGRARLAEQRPCAVHNLPQQQTAALLARGGSSLANAQIKMAVNLEATPNDLARVEDNLFVSFFDGVIQIYSANLLLLRSMAIKENIYLMQNLYFEKLNATKGVAVVAGGELRIYDSNCMYLINSTRLDVS
jgi:hypothetical protein